MPSTTRTTRFGAGYIAEPESAKAMTTEAVWFLPELCTGLRWLGADADAGMSRAVAVVAVATAGDRRACLGSRC